jgi:NADPH:quinone reductase-like Zn-dependent oxidoreductase
MSVRQVAAQGWRYAKHGDPAKVLQLEKFRIPFDRRSGDVVVKMLAAPVHHQDKNLVAGHYGPIRTGKFPAVAGVEGVGVVEEVGSNASLGLKEGDLVWINNQSVGTWATHIVTDANNLDVVPSRPDVDIEFLASLSLFHTAHHLTNSFVNLQPGDVVLQTGASSSVAQICQGYIRARGAKLFQTMQLGRSEHSQLQHFYKLRGAHAVVPYNYIRTNYMRRLLSDVPSPKLLLNHHCGTLASQLLKHLGDNGTVVTYGNTSHRPFQIANSQAIQRGIQFKGFFLPSWIEANSRESRMRVHQQVIESLTISQGHASFRAQRFKMDSDAPFAFSNAWDAPLSSRKPILRMVGEYGEWRKIENTPALVELGRTLWDDINQQMWETSGTTENPQSMKYYTPFNDINQTFYDAKQTRQMGHREVFFKRPNAPRNNTSEASS